jgi:hypothetical protein
MNAILLAAAITLTEGHVYELASRAGFPNKVLSTMVCIANYESARRPHAVGVNKDGSRDIGLFQINKKIWGKVCPGDLTKPWYNARCAKKVYDEQGLNAWIAYRKHKFRCNNYVAKRCPTLTIVDTTKKRWTGIDTLSLRRAKQKCRKTHECLVEFTKIDDGKYRAICGWERR